MSLGNLPEKSTATIRTAYVTELDAEGNYSTGDVISRITENSRILLIPLTICPRYRTTAVVSADKQLATGHTFELKLAMEPPTKLQKSSVPFPESNSNSNTVEISLEDEEAIWNLFQKDLRLQFETSAQMQAMAEVFLSEGNVQESSTAALVTFATADVLQNANNDNNQQEDSMEVSQHSEILFLVDQSGSMRGNPMDQTRQALTYFIHSLSTNCSFNIISFGSTFQKLFKKSQPYSDETLLEAKEYIQQIDASLGGTEIMAPLEDIFKMAQNKNVQLIVLTYVIKMEFH